MAQPAADDFSAVSREDEPPEKASDCRHGSRPGLGQL